MRTLEERKNADAERATISPSLQIDQQATHHLGSRARAVLPGPHHGGATFNLFGSLLSALAMFAALYFLARWATSADPQILRILLNSSRFKTQYDPLKRDQMGLQIIRRQP